MGQGMPMVMTTAPCPLRFSGDFFARDSLGFVEKAGSIGWHSKEKLSLTLVKV